MSKLARKFMLSLSAILILVVLCSLYLNSNFIERYFHYQEKQDLNRTCDALLTSSNLAEDIARLEDTQDVVIALVTNTQDNAKLNQRLKSAFLGKGLGIGNYWLWDQDQKTAQEQGRQLRVYQKPKLHYSLMVEYLDFGEQFVAVAKIIPAMSATISLVNVVTSVVFSAATLLMLLLIYLLVKRITAPLAAIGETAKAIARLDFQTVAVSTNDELEVLAGDINNMSGKLQTAHLELETKNRQMEALLANVSHDLKTPISLIKAYTSAMQDGMDDGTFLDTVIVQNEKMEQMIERLLDLAKIQQQELITAPVDLSALLHTIIAEHQHQAQAHTVSFLCEIEPAVMRTVHRETIQTIFTNLISNAVKYAYQGVIEITLKNEDEACVFQIQNSVNPATHIESERLWEPFYVAEESRNKNSSGTGLGLSIVRAAMQKCGYVCFCELADGKICFIVKI